MEISAQDLVKFWSRPDQSRLTRKQVSLRLPVTVAAKISALCTMFPNKTRTEIIGDLLATALDDLEKALPSYEGEQIDELPDGEPLYDMQGPKREFYDLTRRYEKELEAELDGKASSGSEG